MHINDVRTTSKYWDCECPREYIKPAKQDYCSECCTYRDEQPDSRVNEVKDYIVEPGDTVFVPANQATREALVLAVIGDDALVEYTMPAGTSSLRIIPAACPKSEVYKSISYFKLSKRWLKAIKNAGTGDSMVCAPQKFCGMRRRRSVRGSIVYENYGIFDFNNLWVAKCNGYTITTVSFDDDHVCYKDKDNNIVPLCHA